ncbi:hypothetical protein [Mucilaginibacter psychrotolerans]|uniref:Uncharacterized protein n=1 Tax=Mucilaginibacter psychrotolerans TaxID=1524096 RepID=A0A4Y8SNE7_9SPHI|nr:hypothetical protein [Mucilaginibacter psychrotolerans]TFF40643.1 hypothetical protein E2R66_00210 [Mucilaginibacter psychrotolerans]
MSSIPDRSFWMYWALCLALYIYNYFAPQHHAGKLGAATVGAGIVTGVFCALFLLLIGQFITGVRMGKIFTRFCYLFQAITLLGIIYGVFF